MLSCGRSLWLMAVLAVGLAGCAKQPPPDNGPQPRPMELGEARHFQFAPDGYWHTSDVLVMYGDLLLIEPEGLSKGLALGTVQCRAGGQPLYVEGKESFRFEHFAPLQFMAVSTQVDHFVGPVEVKITKRDDRH